MNIIFDVHLLNPSLPQTATIEQNTLLNKVYEYVESRIKILREEIDFEESQGLGKATVIYIAKKPNAIQPRGYSDKLCDKINGCFNEKDSELMWKSVVDALLILLN